MQSGLTTTELLLMQQLAEKEYKNFIRLQEEILNRSIQTEELQLEYIMAKANLAILQRLLNKLELLILAE
jgi:hypothetical protein